MGDKDVDHSNVNLNSLRSIFIKTVTVTSLALYAIYYRDVRFNRGYHKTQFNI
jgi:hypothetical protein